jgi:hypothetical protein
MFLTVAPACSARTNHHASICSGVRIGFEVIQPCARMRAHARVLHRRLSGASKDIG